MNLSDSQILIYQPEDGKTRIDVRLEDETVWLTQGQMVDLFQSSKQNISLHIRNIFSENELEETAVVKEYLTTAADGKKYLTKYYNLDVIIAVGYRVRSHRGTQFRRWATELLPEYLVKGFTMDDERLKKPPGPGVPDYFDEMLERIRQIFMRDWRERLDDLLKLTQREILEDAGSVSREDADRIAHEHYERFHEQRLRQVEDQAAEHTLQDLRDAASAENKHFLEMRQEAKAIVDRKKG